MNMTLQSSIKGKILAAQKEASDESAGLQRGLDEMIERRSDGALYYLESNRVPLMVIVRTLNRYRISQSTLYTQELIRCIMTLEIETTKKVSQITDRLKAARDHQKSYADKRRKPLEFSVGEYVLLKVSPWKGVVAYRHRLPEELNGVHDTFHVSNLKKCLADPTLRVPLDEIQVDAKLNFVKSSLKSCNER
ncbi:hypothetical protein Tco_0701097 [Tanacetum coccineum]